MGGQALPLLKKDYFNTNPVINEQGQRLGTGTVAEWHDRTDTALALVQ